MTDHPAGEAPDRIAVVLAHVCLRLQSAKDYGFIEGGPDVNVERCEEMIALGQEHGIVPTDAEIDEATEAFVAEAAVSG